MRVAKEFSRFAKSYNKHNIIQAKVAQKLISYIPKRDYKSIIDIGCGRGEIYENLIKEAISFSSFSAFDISSNMLALHPKESRVSLIEGDFGTLDTFSRLSNYDIVISSSALQWSGDLDTTLEGLSGISDEFYFAIFTSQTFSSLHRCAKISSPIYTKEYLKERILEYFEATFELKSYKLYFKSVYEMLRYIKESGTSGGERQLGYKEIKRVIDTYPLDYLEFEVLFVRSGKKA
jgi:malonyl-CoA O-methyltransferase